MLRRYTVPALYYDFEFDSHERRTNLSLFFTPAAKQSDVEIRYSTCCALKGTRFLHGLAVLKQKHFNLSFEIIFFNQINYVIYIHRSIYIFFYFYKKKVSIYHFGINTNRLKMHVLWSFPVISRFCKSFYTIEDCHCEVSVHTSR